MKTNAIYRNTVAVLIALGWSAAHAQSKLEVYTVNYPLAYFAQRIGADSVNVNFPAPRDVDPAFWNPDVATIVEYQKADLVFLNGAGYARWVARTSLPRRKLVDTSRRFRDDLLDIDDFATHVHGPSGAHSHTGTAFVTWLDPAQAIEQAHAIERALARARPLHSKAFATNFEQLAADLEALDAELRTALKAFTGRRLLASHPLYQYLARRYALDLRSVNWEPGEVPDGEEWRGFKMLLESHSARVMLWEAKPRVETSDRLKALGVRSVVFAPCANVPATGDFISIMRQNIAALRATER